MSQPSSGGNGKSAGRRLSINESTVIAALITALGVIVAAFIGGACAGRKIGLVVTLPAVTITATVTQPATSQASPGGASGTQTATGTVLFEKKGVQLTEGYQLSLTDPALRPFLSPNCTGDLYVSGCVSRRVGSTAQLAVYAGQAGFSQCQADTAYMNGYADPNGEPLNGDTLCVTSGNRLAVCYVTADTTQLNGPTLGLTMDVTVYASN